MIQYKKRLKLYKIHTIYFIFCILTKIIKIINKYVRETFPTEEKYAMIILLRNTKVYYFNRYLTFVKKENKTMSSQIHIEIRRYMY